MTKIGSHSTNVNSSNVGFLSELLLYYSPQFLTYELIVLYKQADMHVKTHTHTHTDMYAA